MPAINFYGENFKTRFTNFFCLHFYLDKCIVISIFIPINSVYAVFVRISINPVHAVFVFTSLNSVHTVFVFIQMIFVDIISSYPDNRYVVCSQRCSGLLNSKGKTYDKITYCCSRTRGPNTKSASKHVPSGVRYAHPITRCFSSVLAPNNKENSNLNPSKYSSTVVRLENKFNTRTTSRIVFFFFFARIENGSARECRLFRVAAFNNNIQKTVRRL